MAAQSHLGPAHSSLVARPVPLDYAAAGWVSSSARFAAPAVEAVEGTNAMIDRAGQLCKVGGWTLIKVSNSRQDMRLDVPTVGMTTIEKLHASRGAVLVLEPGKTIILEKAKVLELADRYRIAIVGYAPEPNQQ